MLSYKVVGHGENLVMLYGWGFNNCIFNNLISLYSKQYKITIIDLPGHNGAELYKCDIAIWETAILAVMPKNPIILAWSLGGLLAIKIASRIKIKKLILVATTPKFLNSYSWLYGNDNLEKFRNNFNLNPQKTFNSFLLMQGINNKYLKQIQNNNNRALSCGLDILLTTDLRQTLLSIDAQKIKVFLGKKDIIVPYIIKNWYQQHNITTKIIPTGHLPFYDFTNYL